MTANQIYESGKTIAGELTKIGINLNLGAGGGFGKCPKSIVCNALPGK